MNDIIHSIGKTETDPIDALAIPMSLDRTKTVFVQLDADLGNDEETESGASDKEFLHMI